MPQVNLAVKTRLHESVLDLADQWSNNLKVVDQLESIPSGNYDPSVVLCTLEGILSDYSEPTRNNRWYTERLWERIIESEDFKELEDTKTLFGESDHPLEIEDRVDVHYNYVSHCVRDVKIDRSNKCVRGKIDILDTPAGRIIFTFIKYGSTLGVSSRGAGDLIATDTDGNQYRVTYDDNGKMIKIDRNGNEYDIYVTDRIEVDPESYQFYAWDIVHRPSNRRARPKVVLTESITPDNRLNNLVESAKSDKKSLNWIKSLVESTKIENKTPILDKINEYIEMLDGDDSSLTNAERTAYESAIEALSNDVIKLTELVTEMKAAQVKDPNVSSNGSIDPSQLESLLDTINNIPVRLTESIQHQQSDTLEIVDMVDDISERILDRIDEAYESLIRPLVGISRAIHPFEDMLKANSEFVIGAINDALENQKSISVVDDSELVEMNEKLQKAESQISKLRKENQEIGKRLKSLLESKAIESQKYLSIRCNQLGLNESTVMKRLGNLSEYTFDELDDELNEMYIRGSKASSQSESGVHGVKPIGRAILVESQRNKARPEKLNESGFGDDSLIELIRSNN